MGYRDATKEEKLRFENAVQYVSTLERESLEFDSKHRRVIKRSSLEGASNIGGLSEGELHLCLKYFFEENRDFHEVYFDGYYADILRGERAIEIQTRNFCSFRKKLAAVSEKIPVTVVHPIIKNKRLFWTDPDTGELRGGRTSPVHGDIYGTFRELVYIREIISRENLSFCFPVIECNEYKLLCGWDSKRKKGAVRYGLSPTALLGFYEYDTAFAFASLLPKIDAEFLTVKDVSALIGKKGREASAFVNVLMYLDILCADGKAGRAIKYVYGENY